MAEKNKINISETAESAGKMALDLLGKAKDTVVRAVDHNEDGKLDAKDVETTAKNLGEKAQATFLEIKKFASEKGRELELKKLAPVFPGDLNDADFLLPKMIRVTTIDKKHALSDLCKGSIGHISSEKEMKVVNIYQDKIDEFGLTLYPDKDREIYYVDPNDRDRYIALGEFFRYMKEVRVNELKKIAQDLGAKHVRITLKEEEKVLVEKEDEKTETKASEVPISGKVHVVEVHYQ